MMTSLLGCQTTEEPNFEIDESVEIATQNLQEFIHFLYPSTRNSGLDMVITGIQKKQIPIVSAEENATRNSSAELKEFAELCTISFHMKDQDGYAVVSGDEKVSKVYAYTEKGHISDTSYIFGLKQAIEGIEEIYREDIEEEYYGDPDLLSTRSSITSYSSAVQGFIGLEWGQGWPYNDQIPGSCSINGGKPKTGCVNIAEAMAIAYMEPYMAERENQVSTFRRARTIGGWEPYTAAAAKFIADVTRYCVTTYGCEASSSEISNARNSMLHYYVIHEVTSGLDTNWAKSCLNEGKPLIAFGNPSSGAGHAWMIEGGTTDSNGNYVQFYNNWGHYGNSNGLFAIGNYTLQGKNYNRNNQFLYIFDAVKF